MAATNATKIKPTSVRLREALDEYQKLPKSQRLKRLRSSGVLVAKPKSAKVGKNSTVKSRVGSKRAPKKQ